MMRGPRNLLWMVPMALFVFSPLWWAGVGKFLSPHYELAGKGVETPQRPQIFVMDDVLLRQHVNGVEEWNVRSRQLSSSDSGETLLFDGVAADLLRGGAVLFHIAGKSGRYEQKQQRLELSGDVVVKHKKGDVLYTQQLYYLDRVARITTSKPVRMVGSGMVVRGTGLDYSLDSGTYKVDGRVEVDVE